MRSHPHIDGLFATDPAGVRALVGPHTLRHMAATFATNDDSVSAYAHLAGQFGGVRATRRIADPAVNIQQAIIRRTNPAGDRVAVAPVWGGVELIRDPYTGAGQGPDRDHRDHAGRRRCDAAVWRICPGLVPAGGVTVEFRQRVTIPNGLPYSTIRYGDVAHPLPDSIRGADAFERDSRPGRRREVASR